MEEKMAALYTRVEENRRRFLQVQVQIQRGAVAAEAAQTGVGWSLTNQNEYRGTSRSIDRRRASLVSKELWLDNA